MFGSSGSSKVAPAERASQLHVPLAGANDDSRSLGRFNSVARNSTAAAFLGSNGTGLLVPGGGTAENVALAVKSVSAMRKSSVVLDHVTMHGTPGMGAKNGSIASYFYAPHPQPGRGVCFSPNGEYLVRYGFGNELRLLKAVNCSVANTLKSSTGNIRYATFSGDSKYIIAATDDMQLLVYDVEAAVAGHKAILANIDVGAEPVAFCVLSPDGKTVLSCDDDGQLETWSVSREVMLVRYEPGHSAKRASFADDGKTIISCSDFEVGLSLLDAASGHVTVTEPFDSLEEGRNKAEYSIAQDGSRVIAYIKEQTWGCNLAVYHTARQTYTKLRVCDGAALHVEFSADGQEFIVAGRDDKIHVYDSESGEIITTLEGHASDVMYCRVSGDRHFAISGDNGGHVMLWDVDRGQLVMRLQAHKAPVCLCDLSADCTRAFTLDLEGHAYLWYLDMQGVFDVMHQMSDMLCCMEFTTDSRRMAVGYSDGTLRLWSVGLYVSQAWCHNEHTTPVQCLALCHAAGTVASAGRDGRIILTGLNNGQVLASVIGHSDMVTSVSYANDGSKLLSTSRDGTVCVWSGRPPADLADSASESTTRSTPTMRPIHALKTPVTQCSAMQGVLSHDGKLAAVAFSQGRVATWNTSAGTLLYSSQVSDVNATAIMFSDDSRYLIAGSSDGSTTVLEGELGSVLRVLTCNAAGVGNVFFEHGGVAKELGESRVVSVCSQQAITWDLSGNGSKACIADFIADSKGIFHNRTMQNRVFVAHQGLTMFDPLLSAVMYDMREYEKHPGNSFMFRDSTNVQVGGVHHQRMVLYSPPHTTISMLVNETGGVKALDFCPDGLLLVSGNLRGELSIWDVQHRQLIRSWMAHKRSAITCVKFSHDSSRVYSCGEDAKVILWDWRTGNQVATLMGHQAAVITVEMSLDGLTMASGDKEGFIIVWDTISQSAKQFMPVHEGPVLCCSLSPDGSKVASSGADEHIRIMDTTTGNELMKLDDALDGKGLTIKFSFDGTRVQIGSEKGIILIWHVANNYLMYDITAHEGSVYDASWSGDSRRLLSVGSDGRARLWDAAAGSELCQANFERGFGVVESGGFVKCDLSANGSTMAGCTAKGHLILWETGQELRKGPNGQMLYQWLASMPLGRTKDIYGRLIEYYPLLFNAQDSRGWTVLMHAAASSNPEITKLIVSTVPARSGMLGLMASPLQSTPGVPTLGASMHLNDSDRNNDHVMPFLHLEDGKDRAPSNPLGSGAGFTSPLTTHVPEMPNAIRIAIEAGSADCVNHLLTAVLQEKVTPGSYIAVTQAIPEVAEQYPTMCQTFLSGLPLRALGEMEIPSSQAGKGMIVTAATSYTSYKELWHEALRLDEAEKGPMVVMEALMVRLPFAADLGKQSMLHTLVESRVPVETFGSDTVKAIIDFKWKRYARSSIYTKSGVYLLFVILFTAYAILLSDDPGPSDDEDGSGATFSELAQTGKGLSSIILSFIIFGFGLYYMGMEALQLFKLGAAAYFDSFWNFIDLASYAVCLTITPCVLLRVGLRDGEFVSALVALETILLWTKAMFFGLAVDGLGTFIYMTSEIVKGMRYFIVLLATLYLGFGVAFMNLFRKEAFTGDTMFDRYGTFGKALLSSYLTTFDFEDPRSAFDTNYPQISITVMCIYNFLLIVVLLNMLITLMGDVYKKVKKKQAFVFLQNRAELILEVESTMNAMQLARQSNIEPFLHILRPIDASGGKDGGDDDGGDDETNLSAIVASVLKQLQDEGKLAGSSGTSGPTPPNEAAGGGELTKESSGNLVEATSFRAPASSTPQLQTATTFRSIKSFAAGRQSHSGNISLAGLPSGLGREERLERIVEHVHREIIVLRKAVDGLVKHHGLPSARPSNDGMFPESSVNSVPFSKATSGRLRTTRNARNSQTMIPSRRDSATLPISPNTIPPGLSYPDEDNIAVRLSTAGAHLPALERHIQLPPVHSDSIKMPSLPGIPQPSIPSVHTEGGTLFVEVSEHREDSVSSRTSRKSARPSE